MGEPIKSKFVIMEHHAKRAGLHYDLRFRMPNSDMWASFLSSSDVRYVFSVKTRL